MFSISIFYNHNKQIELHITTRMHTQLSKKIAGRKRPALVVPSHNVHQGSKGSVWDGQTDGHFRSTSGQTDGRFDGTSGPFGHHRWSYEASQL